MGKGKPSFARHLPSAKHCSGWTSLILKGFCDNFYNYSHFRDEDIEVWRGKDRGSVWGSTVKQIC